MTRPTIIGALFACLALPAAALEVDLELVLAVDVSASVDAQEARQQRDGYLYALAHPEVVRAIAAGETGRIAIAYVEWAGRQHQRVVVDWTVIDGPASAAAFVAALADQPISSAPATSISAVIDFARREFARNGHVGARRIIDVSGDGPNSDGRPVEAARDRAVVEGITINGLPILSIGPDKDGFAPATEVYRHYRRRVIGGVDAFVMPAQAFEDLGEALLEKIKREIRGDAPIAIGPPAGRRFASRGG